MPKNLFVLVALWLMIAVASPAATTSGSFIIDSWESDDGLPQNSIISMTQTRNGYLWLGTLNGLVRFDGIRFAVFDEFNTPGLNNSQIIKVFADSQDNLWVGTETSGITIIRDGTAEHLGISSSPLTHACEDTNGTVWLLTARGELWRYADNNAERIPLPSTPRYHSLISEGGNTLLLGSNRGISVRDPLNPTDNDLLPELEFLVIGDNSNLNALLSSKSGGYWRLADGLILKWNGNRIESAAQAYAWNPELPIVTAEDGDGNLWVGTATAGLFHYDGQGNVTHISKANGLSYDYIISLHFDSQGNLWVGTDGGGLNRVKPHVFDTLQSTREAVIQSVAEDETGGLWIGSNGNGVMYYKNGVTKTFGPEEGLYARFVRTVFVDNNQNVWAGTRNEGLFQFVDGSFQRVASVNRTEVFAIHQDANDVIWLGTRSGLLKQSNQGWQRYTTNDGLSGNTVQAIAHDQSGNLWVGTIGGGLSRLKDNEFTTFTTEDGLPSNDISSLLVDKDGNLWIGTRGKGLCRMIDNTWTPFTTDNGLTSNHIGYIIEDKEGNLWIGSNAGLMRVAKSEFDRVAQGEIQTVHCRTYGQPDGMPIRECSRRSQPGATMDRSGRLWFPTIKGLTSVNPTEMTPNPRPPPVIIESVAIDGQMSKSENLTARTIRSVTLPPDKERLEIHYTALNFSSPDRARFRYRMQGHETDWTMADSARVARYSKLPHGNYQFVVSASNEDGIWNELGASLEVLVPPPFWKTWWFLTLCSVALLGSTVATVHYISTQKLQRELENLKHGEELEAERKRIARDLHDQLGASLTQVSLLGELIEADKDYPEEVEDHAKQVTQTALETTRVFDEIVWAINPSNDTLDSLVTYICKYAQDYLGVAGLSYRIEVPPDVPEAAVLPEVRHNVFLASKEAITNVVRHAKASSAWIRLKFSPSEFTLEIADNGTGIPEERKETTRNGLKNMNNRMSEINGRFEINDSPEGGTLISLTAPIRGN